MSQPDEINIESILTELRNRTRQASAPNSSYSDNERALGEPLPEITTLYANYDICRDPFRSHRRFLGNIIIRVKNFAKELLVQILERQVRYNAANAKVVMALRQQAVLLTQSYSELRNGIDTWRAKLDQAQADLASRLTDLAGNQGDARRALEALQTKLDRSLEALDTRINSSVEALTTMISSQSKDHQVNMSDLEARKADAATLSDVQREHMDILRQLQDHKRLALDQQRRLAIMLEEVRKRLAPTIVDEQLDKIASERDHLLDSMFVTFDDRFRGTREDIKERLKVYLPYISALNIQSMPLLDIGCGRGEFLELLHDQGVQAKGVDFNRVLVDQCHSLDLDVVEGEAFAFLRQQKDCALAAVSAIHLLEHLPFRRIIAVLDEVLRVLKPGGLAILETPNPENVLVGSGTFYLDPTHRKPLPAPLLQFIVEERGFCGVQLLYLHPFPAFYMLEGSPIATRCNELFYGPRDYALLAYKV